MPTSKAAAARINGAKSKGPTTAAGKAISSRNAIQHGLTSESVMVEGESLEAYTDLRDAYVEQFQPANQMELDLIESLAATRIRLRRAIAVETGLLDNEIAEVAGDDHRIASAFERSMVSILRLNRYETALNRAFDRTLKQLQALQKARLAAPPAELRNEPTLMPEILEFPSTPDINEPDDEDYCVEKASSTLPGSAVPE